MFNSGINIPRCLGEKKRRFETRNHHLPVSSVCELSSAWVIQLTIPIEFMPFYLMLVSQLSLAHSIGSSPRMQQLQLHWGPEQPHAYLLIKPLVCACVCSVLLPHSDQIWQASAGREDCAEVSTNYSVRSLSWFATWCVQVDILVKCYPSCCDVWKLRLLQHDLR